MEGEGQHALGENDHAPLSRRASNDEQPIQAEQPISEVQHLARGDVDAEQAGPVENDTQGADAAAIIYASQSAEDGGQQQVPPETSSANAHSRKGSHASAADNVSRRRSRRTSLSANTLNEVVQNADSGAVDEGPTQQNGVAEVQGGISDNANVRRTSATTSDAPVASVAEVSAHDVSARVRRHSEAATHADESSRGERRKSSRRSSTRRQSQADSSLADGEPLLRKLSSRSKSSTRKESQAGDVDSGGELPSTKELSHVPNPTNAFPSDSAIHVEQQRQSVVGGDLSVKAESGEALQRPSMDGAFRTPESVLGEGADFSGNALTDGGNSLEKRPQASADEGTLWMEQRRTSSSHRIDEEHEVVHQAPQTTNGEQVIIPGQIEDDEDDTEFQPQVQVVVSKEEILTPVAASTTVEPVPDMARSSVVDVPPEAAAVGNRRDGQRVNDGSVQNSCQRPAAHPRVRVVVTADAEAKESRGYATRPTFFHSMLKDGEVDFGPNTSRLEKIRVVSFSGGRVFDALHLEENCIFVKEKKKYVPLDQLRAFIRIMVDDMEKMKRQSIDAITEMEWNFRILDQKTKKRCETQVNTVKSRALEKLELLRKKVLEYKAQMEFFETQYSQLKETFEERVRKFKEQMPKDLQELDARWEEKVAEVQKVLQTTQSALDSSLKIQEEVGVKVNKFIEELSEAEAGSHQSDEAGLLERMNNLHVVLRRVVEDNTKEQVALVVRQLVDLVGMEQQEKKIASLERENGALKDICGTGLQRRMEEYEKEIVDLQAACRAAEAGASSGGGASYEEVEKLRNELTVLNAENMILRRKVHGAAGGGAGLIDGALTAWERESAGSGSGGDSLLIQELTLTVEGLDRQIKSLKEENEQLQAQLITAEESASKGGKAAGKPGEGAGARLVQQLQQKNKMLEAQVEPMKKKIRELEVMQKKGGGADADQRIRELEMKLKDAEAEARKQQRQLEQEMNKSSKGTGLEVRKLENQIQKLTERATEAETILETTSKELKETKKERDGFKKEADELRQQMGQAQEIIAEVQTLRVQTKEQNTKLAELEESYKHEKSLRKKYYNEIEDMKGKIRVYCRIRPMAKYELEKNCMQSVHPVDEYSVKVQTAKGDKEFMFDRTFPPEISQEAVYEDTQRLIQSVIDGFNVCIFAYGQTGSGKTFTIQGNANFPGVAPRAINDLFDTLDSYDKQKFTYTVDVYMCELYNNQLVDLLLPDDKKKAPPALDIKKDVTGMVVIPGITLRKVQNKGDLSKIFAYGLEARHVSGTAMNAESSRSHLIFSVIVTLEDKVARKRANGKLSLIDLAGSERVSKSGVTKERLVEAKEINKSLSALGDVISALSSGESFVPYRNHKLTQLMSDSLGGTAKTLMFVNVSPADYNTDETVTSLMYASRVKLITNDATKQVESKQLATMKDTIKNLTLIIEKLKKGEDTYDLEKQLNQGKAGAPQDDEVPPPEQPENEQDYEEPPDVPAD